MMVITILADIFKPFNIPLSPVSRYFLLFVIKLSKRHIYRNVFDFFYLFVTYINFINFSVS